MDFGILGALEVRDEHGPVELRGTKPRTVLALLVVHAGEPLSSDRLVDELWQGSPPRSATTTLQTYVSQLRKRLPPGTLVTGPAGYCLEIDAEAVDACRFERGLREVASTNAANPAWLAARLDDALGLWRGSALVEFAGMHWADVEAARLESLRVLGLEDRCDVRLALGEHAALVPELESFTETWPLRERLWAQLVLALYRCDRQADALRAYGRLRSRLGEELGIEPSAELARLEEAVILQKPELEWRPPARAPAVVTEPIATALPTGTVTLMLTDVVGSTSLWDRHPQEMAEALDAHDAIVARVVMAHRGHVVKQRREGDSTFSAFERATDAVEAALQAMHELRRHPWPPGARIDVRAGIHSGEALERDGDYYGTTVNRAARLRDLAEAGQVVLSRATVDLVVDHLGRELTLVELGAHTLRGLERPERVFLASARADAAAVAATEPDVREEAPRLPLSSRLADAAMMPFVGREAELATVHETWKEVLANGGPRAVLVSGEPGIGKTRLAADVARGVADSDGTVLFGWCDEELEVPYQPFAEALRHCVGHTAGPVLLQQLGVHAGELAHLVPDLGARVPGIRAPLIAEPETERYQLFEAVAEWLESLARVTPVLLVIDDVQWASTPTLLMLRHVLGGDRATRLLVLCTYRETDALGPLPHWIEGVGARSRVELLTLEGLDERETLQLVGDVLGSETPSMPRVARVLYERADGNPLLTTELLRHLDDYADLQEVAPLPVEERRPEVAGVAVPSSVRDLVARRVVSMGADAGPIVTAAAVIGESVDVELVYRVVTPVRELDEVIDVLDEAVGRGLLIDDRSVPGRYRFRHGLVRDAVYAGLSPTRRAALHLRVAEAIEATRRPDPEAVPLLSRHFAAAGPFAVERATEYALLAARQALARLAYEQATEELEVGLATARLHGRDLSRRIELLLALADARSRLFDVAGMRDAALEAAALARSTGAAESLALAAIAYATEAVAGAREDMSIDLCTEALERGGVSLASRVRLEALLGAHLAWTGDARAEELSRGALERARSECGPEVLAATLPTRFVCLMSSPDTAARRRVAEELLSLGEARGEVDNIRQGLRLRALAALSMGDPGRYRDDARAIQALTVEYGGRFYVALMTLWRGMEELLVGRFDDAERSAQEVLEHAGDDPNFVNVWAIQMMAIRTEQGRHPEVAPLIAAAVEHYPELPALAAAHALTLVELGDLDRAADIMSGLAEDGFARLRNSPLWTSCIPPLAEVSIATEDRARAPQLHDLFRPYAGQLIVVATGSHCAGSVDRYLGMVCALSRRYDDAETWLRSALDLERRIGGAPLVARTQYWLARTLLEHGGAANAAETRRLAADALATAPALGMTSLSAQLERLVGDPRHET